MKILFIVRSIDFIDPTAVMLLSAIAKAKGHQTFLGIMLRENILKKINDIKPHVVAYSASTGEHKYYINFDSIIKKNFKVFSIMGGAHPTFFPECIHKSTIDSICVGEGEEAFPEVLDALGNGGDVSRIRNIYTKEGSQEIRPLYENLDDLPFPDRDIFYETTEMGRFPIKGFILSRGCPYQCTYCFNHAFKKMYQGKGTLLRRRSVESSIEEIVSVKKKYPIQFIKFYDDIFAYPNDSWLEEFLKVYKRKIGLSFHCATRCNLVNEDMVKMLKEAGCRSVNMSIEAGNSTIRNEILKRGMSNKQIIDSFALFHKHGIKIFSNSILGLPFSKIKNEIETIDMTINCKINFSEFPIYAPYPKTQLGEVCLREGIFNGDFDSLHMSNQNRSSLSCFTDKEKDIQKNIALLGMFAVWKPFFRNLILNYLIYLPTNRLYFWSYLLLKTYLVKTKIYPFKAKLSDLPMMLCKAFKLDTFKHSEEDAVRL